MSKERKLVRKAATEPHLPDYDRVLGGVVELLEAARRAAARSVNALITATYWEIGRRVVEFEQGGQDRSQYGSRVLERLSADLTAKFGRGFSYVNLTQMRRFYLAWPTGQIIQTPSEEFTGTSAKGQTAANVLSSSEETIVPFAHLATRFPLPWSHYVLLLKVEKPEAREFYEAEAHRNGWTVRQLDRQISTLFYERTLASRNKPRETLPVLRNARNVGIAPETPPLTGRLAIGHRPPGDYAAKPLRRVICSYRKIEDCRAPACPPRYSPLAQGGPSHVPRGSPTARSP